MLKENSAFKESLRRKLDTKDEIGKVNKDRKNNNNDSLKEKANSECSKSKSGSSQQRRQEV